MNDLDQGKQKYIVMLTSAGRGGIRAVVDTLERDGLFSRWNIRVLYTHDDGSLPCRLFVAFTALLSFISLLLTRQVSFVHCHVAMKGSFWRKSLFATVAQIFRIPVVFHLHGSEMKPFYFGRGKFFRRLISGQLERASHVLVLSESWREFVKEIAPRANVTIIPNYISPPPLSACHQQHDGTRVLFLGMFGERKGVYDLLKAFSQISALVPDMELFLGGNGEVDEVAEAVKGYGLESKVNVLGWVSGDAKKKLLETGDIFVLPSYNEGLPVSILEAMSWEIPVISTRVGGIPQLVRDGTDGILINPGDVEALSQALLALGRQVEFRQQLGRAARSRIEASYSRENVLPQLEAIYQALISRKPQS